MISRVSLAAWSGTLLAMALAAAGAGSAAAQPDLTTATAHYQAAEDAMARGAWADAAREYDAAYQLGKDPILLFKLGTAHARAGACDAARAAFDRYLAEGNPTPEYRAQAEDRGATCAAPVAPAAGAGAGGATPAGTAATTGTPTPAAGTGGGPMPGAYGTRPGAAGGARDDADVLPSLGAGGPSFTDTQSTWKRSAGWIAVGTTIGLVAVGTVLALSAEGSEEDLGALIDFRNPQDGSDRPLRWDEIDDQYVELVDEGERFDRMATYTFAIAGATAAAAVTFFVLDAVTGSPERAELTTTIAPRVGRDGASVDVGWRF